jgi:hypothetical protein
MLVLIVGTSKEIELLIARIIMIICANVSSLANWYCFLLLLVFEVSMMFSGRFPLSLPLSSWPKRKKQILG